MILLYTRCFIWINHSRHLIVNFRYKLEQNGNLCQIRIAIDFEQSNPRQQRVFRRCARRTDAINRAVVLLMDGLLKRYFILCVGFG